MKVVILQTNYLPWKGYFDLVHDADLFVYFDDVQYTKNDWRNRNKIYSKNGLLWLTIPISKQSVRKTIREVTFADSKWQKKHHASICASYGRAPYFHDIEALIDTVYAGGSWHSLSQLNRYCIEHISNALGCRTTFRDAKTISVGGNRVERLVGILNQVGASTYISGPSAKAYLSGFETLFAKYNIALKFKDYSGYPDYQQLRTPFEHGVSIIDLIANVGIKRAPWFIWGWRNHPFQS